MGNNGSSDNKEAKSTYDIFNVKSMSAEETAKMGTYKNLSEENSMPAFMFEEDKREKKNLEIEHCELPPEFDGKLGRKLAFVLPDVFTKDECSEIVAWTEKHLRYEPALLNIGHGKQILDTQSRFHDRAIYDSHRIVEILFKRIEDHLPKEWMGKEISGLNERLRFLRYEKGGYFAPHWDGSYMRPDRSERSYHTLILYLNDDFEGGQTNFLKTRPVSDRKNEWPVGIKTGSVLIFQHDIYHEGDLLKEGRKYCVRTDVMYKNETKKIQTPSA